MLQFTEEFEYRKILHLLARSVPYYLASWQDIDDRRGLFGTTDPRSYNMKSVGSSSPVIEYVVQPHLQVLATLSVFVYRDECDVLSDTIPRSILQEKIEKGMRWACDTHLTGSLDVESFLECKRWGRNWRSGLWAATLGLAARLMGDSLSPESAHSVERVLAFEADRFIGTLPPSGCEVDTKLEENAQDGLVLACALTMVSDHPNARQWESALRLWSINIASCILDKADHSSYFGLSVSSQVLTQTLFPDMTAENHGFFNPAVIGYTSWIVVALCFYELADRPPPVFLQRKRHQETYEILLRFCLPTGMLYEPAGQDLPMFIPRPLALAWGIWNNDPRALRLCGRLLAWMDELTSRNAEDSGQWVKGLNPTHEGWELLFQSRAGFELAMLAVLPVRREQRFYSSGQIENAMDTRKIYPYVQVCYRRNYRLTRSVAWKAIGNHPLISLSIHTQPELVAGGKAQLLGVPSIKGQPSHPRVLFHRERYIRGGFDTYGRILYVDERKEPLLSRDIRVLTWGDDGIVVLDRIVARRELTVNEQYLSPLYLVNDLWTGSKLDFHSGSLQERFPAAESMHREISCPAFWASIENHLLFQFLWGRTKGLIYLPGGTRNAPAYWKNARLDMMAVHVRGANASEGDVVYRVGFYVGCGKGPRPFKSAGTAGKFFKGLVLMDGKNTIGLD